MTTSCRGEKSTCGALGRKRQRRHRVQVDARLAVLEMPAAVVELGPVDAPAVLGVEAVAVGQELVERARLGVEQVADPAVARAERRPARADS